LVISVTRRQPILVLVNGVPGDLVMAFCIIQSRPLYNGRVTTPTSSVVFGQSDHSPLTSLSIRSPRSTVTIVTKDYCAWFQETLEGSGPVADIPTRTMTFVRALLHADVTVRVTARTCERHDAQSDVGMMLLCKPRLTIQRDKNVAVEQ
jgi:hypothetical protein